MNMKNIFEIYARYYHELNFNVTYVSNKITAYNFGNPNPLKGAANPYKHLYESRQDIDELLTFDWDSALGVGAIIGLNNIMLIDIDGCIEYKLIEKICEFLKIPKDYEWIIETGSGAGYHLLFECASREIELNKERKMYGDDYPFGERKVDSYFPKPKNYLFPKHKDETYYINWFEENKVPFFKNLINGEFHLRNLFEKIEFGWKCHVILPPSNHVSGLNYKFKNGTPENEPISIDFRLLEDLKNEIAAFEEHSPGTLSWEVEVKENIERFIEDKDVKYIIFNIVTNDPILNAYKDDEPIPDILQISYLLLNADMSLLQQKSYLIRHENILLNKEHQKFHGIKEVELESFGLPLKEVLNNFLDDIIKTEAVLASFEYNKLRSIVENSMKNVGINHRILQNASSLCIKDEYLSLYGRSTVFGFRNIKISQVYFDLFRNEVVTKYNAIYDVILFKKVLLKIMQKKESDFLI